MGFGNAMKKVKYIKKARKNCIKERKCEKDEPMLGGIALRKGIGLLISQRSYFWKQL